MLDRRTFLTATALLAASTAITPARASSNPITFPPELKRGDLIGITSPSAGVSKALRPRMQFAYRNLRRLGYGYREGKCLWGKGLMSAPPKARAEELMEMLLDEVPYNETIEPGVFTDSLPIEVQAANLESARLVAVPNEEECNVDEDNEILLMPPFCMVPE